MTKSLPTIEISNDAGERVCAQCPVILSVSRSTDIPAFYADWLMERLRKGHLLWKNPFSCKGTYLALEQVRLIVFWTKNPRPLLPYLQELEDRGIRYYFQYTLNDYEAEGWEPHLPALAERLETFQELSGRIGKQKVIWRFDPLMLSDRLDVRGLLQKAENLGEQLKDYTERLVFSFADVGIYRSVKRNLVKAGVAYREFTPQDMKAWMKGIAALNRNWNLELRTCAEQADGTAYGIFPSKCVDDALITRLFPQDPLLMEYLQNVSRDKGQRALCQCIPSKSIGEYNTCPHGCIYCYANSRPEEVKRNYEKHRAYPDAETLIPGS